MREVLRRASEADLARSPPSFGRSLHQWVLRIEEAYSGAEKLFPQERR